MELATPVDTLLVAFATGLTEPSSVRKQLTELAQAHDSIACSMLEQEDESWQAPIGLTPSPYGLLDRPIARLFRNVLHPIECAYLIARSSAELLQPSAVTSNNGSRLDPGFRRSWSRPISLATLQAGERFILDKAAAVAKLGNNIWDRNIVKYDPGDIFRPHFDPIKPSASNPGGVRRIETNIVYLNSKYSGGETAFVRARQAFKGGTGDMLQFSNELANGEVDPFSLHAGLPVASGSKWILVQWRSC